MNAPLDIVRKPSVCPHDCPSVCALDVEVIGGSRIGRGICVRRSGTAPPIASHLGGYLRIESDDFAQAERLLAGNPVFEAGGTIEIRELPRG